MQRAYPYLTRVSLSDRVEWHFDGANWAPVLGKYQRAVVSAWHADNGTSAEQHADDISDTQSLIDDFAARFDDD